MTTNTSYHRQMWNRAVGVYGSRRAADFNALDLTRDTGVHHHVRAFIDVSLGDVYTQFGIFADMDVVAATELEVAFNSGTMVTATYTDPITDWVQRVEVVELLADAAVVRNTDDMVVQVPVSTLTEPHREQDDDREYLPRALAGTR